MVLFAISTLELADSLSWLPTADHFWIDATVTALVDFYFHNFCEESLRKEQATKQFPLDRYGLAIFTSDWAAKCTLEDYKTDPAKVKVGSYGANLVSVYSLIW